MMGFLFAWRCELLTTLTVLLSWATFARLLHQPFWRLLVAGTVLGAAVEYMTEPEWTYFVKIYLWRDITPFIILGWGVVFTWLVTVSDALYFRIFGKGKAFPAKPGLGILATDLLVGVPLFLGNELFGLHVLKIWRYNECLHWNSMIPGIDYPWEGLVAIFLYALAVPNTVRFWKGY